jgi:hypothetical protein
MQLTACALPVLARAAGFCDDNDYSCQPYAALAMSPFEAALIALGCAVALAAALTAYLCISGRLRCMPGAATADVAPLVRADSGAAYSTVVYAPALCLLSDTQQL